MIRRVLAVFLIGWIVLLAGQGTASAHAILEQSTPADGSTLAAAPASITLTFDESVLVRSATASLRSGHGTVLASSGTTAADLRIAGPDEGTEVVIGLPALAKGTFALTWQVQSADDLHRTSGTLVFGIGEAVTASTPDRWGPAPGALASVLRWLDLLAVAVLLGAMLVLLAVLPRSRSEQTSVAVIGRLLGRIALAAAGFDALIALALLLNATRGSDLATVLTQSLFGRLWLGREFALIALVVLIAVRLRGRLVIASRVIGAVTLCGSLTALASASHAGSGSGRPIAIAILTLHLAAGAAWAGGLFVLCLLGLLLRRPDTTVRARSLLRAFGIPAAFCVATVVVTGIALTGRQVASVDALLSTAYGQILIVKVVLVAVAALLGLRATLRLHTRRRAPSVRSLRRGVWAESAVLAGVVVAAAALAAGTPARGPAFAPTVHGDQPRLAAQVSDLFMAADLSPNAVGQSWLRVTVSQTRRPIPAPITGVSTTLISPHGGAAATRPLAPSDIADRWDLSGVNLTSAGTWQLSIAVHRSGRADTVWNARWIVPGGPLGDRQAVISDRPWRGQLDALALGLGAAALILGAGLVARRRRPRPQARADDAEDRTLARV